LTQTTSPRMGLRVFYVLLLSLCCVFTTAQDVTQLTSGVQVTGTTVGGSLTLYSIELNDPQNNNIYINASLIFGSTQTVLYVRYNSPPTTTNYDNLMKLDDADDDCAFAFTPYCPYLNQNNSGVYYIGVTSPVSGTQFRLTASVLSNKVELNTLYVLQGAPYQPGFVFWVDIPSNVASLNLTVLYSRMYLSTVEASLAEESEQDGDCNAFDYDDLTLFVPSGEPGSIILNEFSDPPLQPGAWRLRFQTFICSDSANPYIFTLCETGSADCPPLVFPDSDDAFTLGFSSLLIMASLFVTTF